MTWILSVRLLDAIMRWRESRTIIFRLSRLNDHLLQDIGIHRHEIASAVQQSARSAPVSYIGHRKAVVLPNGSVLDFQRRAGPGLL